MSFKKTLCKGDIDSLKKYLEENPDAINHQDEKGRTPLYLAVETGKLAMVEMLIKRGANINVGNNDGDTPLHVACLCGHTAIVKVLITSDPNVNAENNDGDTPLHVACLGGLDAIVEMLITSGPNVNVVNNDGDTPLHLAVLWKHHDVVAVMLLQGHQVQMEKKNSLQQTPFLLAVSEGDFGLIHILVSNGAYINAVDADGNNCLHLALETKKFHSRRKYLDVLDEFCSKPSLSKEDRHSPKVVASYLASQGVNLYHTNQNNKTPLDLIDDPDFKNELVFFSHQAKCMLCEENEVTVKFHPCGHKVICEECAKIRLKRCHWCQQLITRKIGFEPQKPKERDLRKVANKLGGKWQSVGTFLGIKKVDLEIIMNDNPQNTQEQCFQMLYKWFTSCGPELCTYEVLRNALEETECFDAIKQLPSDEK